jgi:hypothetical protein
VASQAGSRTQWSQKPVERERCFLAKKEREGLDGEAGGLGREGNTTTKRVEQRRSENRLS